MNSKQTAVEWLIDKISPYITDEKATPLIEQAKQMEAEQLNQACYDGSYTEAWYDTRNYYKDTYGK